ncbi:DUF6415 family natural product biosynthesis protein [Streptomyces sp. YS-3]|uniref:DUF6415 family natural product biosynthesis protein n=1 Tax=Streptomyces sp. YS-3 TaxID=3381352 RepID=UPI003862C033
MIDHVARNRAAAVSDWLGAAHPNPGQARAEWGDPRKGHIALLPTGQVFDTVRVAAKVVHAAAGAQDEASVAAFLGALLDGPVIHDAYSATGASVYYFLVPLGSCAHHLADDARLLAPGTWVGVPEPTRTARPGSFWILPPRQRDDLCIPGYVDQLIRAGRRALAAPPPEVPGMDRIVHECRALIDPAPDAVADPSYDDANALILRMRGYLLQLVAAVEEHAERRPPTEVLTTRGRYRTTEARLLLEEAPDACVVPRMYEHARRQAACALNLVDWLRECSGQATGQ